MRHLQATVEVLQEFDVEAAAAVRGAAALKEADWKELLRQEGLDPGTKRRAYIKFAAYRLLVQDVQWQFAAFAQVGDDGEFHNALSCLQGIRERFLRGEMSVGLVIMQGLNLFRETHLCYPCSICLLLFFLGHHVDRPDWELANNQNLVDWTGLLYSSGLQSHPQMAADSPGPGEMGLRSTCECPSSRHRLTVHDCH